MLSFSKSIDFILMQARIKEIAALACTAVVQMKDLQDCRHLLLKNDYFFNWALAS